MSKVKSDKRVSISSKCKKSIANVDESVVVGVVNSSTCSNPNKKSIVTLSPSSTSSSNSKLDIDLNNNEIILVKSGNNSYTENGSTTFSSSGSQLAVYQQQQNDFAATNNETTNSITTTNQTVSLATTTTTSSGMSSSPAASFHTQPKASSKSNDRFHQLFPSIPIEEYVIDTYSCAYAKSLNLYQGVMFLTRNFICFYSKILTHTNILILKFTHINSITKTMHAVIFPTAIRIETQNSIYSFTSFRSRSNTLDHLTELLQQSRQRQVNESSLRNEEKKVYIESEQYLENDDDDDDDGLKDDELIKRRTCRSGVTSSTASEVIEETNSLTSTESECSLKKNNKKLNDCNTPSKPATFVDNNNNSKIIASQFNQQPNMYKSNVHTTGFYSFYNNKPSSDDLIYDFDFSDLSRNMVTVSLRHKKTLIQKIQVLIGIFIPGFFNISRIDALLPICFIMCILLLLNAFVLLNKVNKVDDLFTKLLTTKSDI